MPTVAVPLTTYSVRQSHPGHQYGAPAEIPLRTGGAGSCRLLARVPLDRIPADAIITSAVVQIWTSRAVTGAVNMRAYPIVEAWKSSVTWDSRPAIGALIDSESQTNPAINSLYTLDVSAWAATRARNGLSIDVSGTIAGYTRGSASAINKPVLLVSYTIIPEVPTNLVPNGGAVSVSRPVLAYEAEEDMAQQNVQYSSDGTVVGVTLDTGWLAASVGRYDPLTSTAPSGFSGVVGDSVTSFNTAFSNHAAYAITPAVDVVVTHVRIDLGGGGGPGPFYAGVASALSATMAGTVWMPGGQAVVPSPGAAANGVQVALPSPVLLKAGITYYVVATNQGGGTCNIQGRNPTNRTASPAGLTLGSGASTGSGANWGAALAGYGANVRLFADGSGGPTAPVLTDGQATYWRVRTNGPNGISAWSAWARYSYEVLTPPVITNPPALTDDGSPTLQWTVADQVSWRATFLDGSKVLNSVPWDENSVVRSWIPAKSVPVPGGHGQFILEVKDSTVPRVAAEGAPTWSTISVSFDTIVSGSATAVTGMSAVYVEPVVVITGNRAAGIPDYIALYRDGVQVPIWDADGDPHMWGAGADFFTGSAFTLRDFTAEPRATHTWTVRTKVGGVASAASAGVTLRIFTPSLWLVNPRTREQIDIQGYGDVPVIEQAVEEGSILHVPIHGDLVVEPVRRRILRTTRSGHIEGVVLDANEDILNRWILDDSGLKYRLIFGKVNWSVILGDHSPSDMFYADDCGPDRILVAVNWWERLADY